MKDRIKINGVWYRREDISTPEEEDRLEKNLIESRTMLIEGEYFSYELTDLKNDKGKYYKEPYLSIKELGAEGKEVEFWDNPSYLKYIAINKKLPFIETADVFGGKIEKQDSSDIYDKDKKVIDFLTGKAYKKGWFKDSYKNEYNKSR